MGRLGRIVLLTRFTFTQKTEDQQRLRFQVELEFVQSFANPNYLNFLAQRGYFKDPNYAKYLKYPMCLHFLDLLQYEHFRKEIVSSQCSRFIEDQQLLHWQHYTRKRVKLLQNQIDKHIPNETK